MNRRNFLNQSGKVTLALGVLNPLHAWANWHEQPKKVTVSGHLWVYAAKQPGYDPTPVLGQVFADLAYAGFAGVELMHQVLRQGDTVNKIGELKEKHKIRVIGTSYGANMWDSTQHTQILEDAEQVITRLAKLGGRTFGVSVGAAAAAKTPEQLEAQAQLIKKLMTIGQQNKVVLNLHNHTYEVENNQYDLKATLERVPGVKLGPDLNWLMRAGVNPADFIREHGKKIVFLHIRDQHRSGRWAESVGEGDTDFAAIGQALKAINFSGDAVVELAHEGDFTPTRPLKESWKMSREFVRKTLGY